AVVIGFAFRRLRKLLGDDVELDFRGDGGRAALGLVFLAGGISGGLFYRLFAGLRFSGSFGVVRLRGRALVGRDSGRLVGARIVRSGLVGTGFRRFRGSLGRFGGGLGGLGG